MFIIGLIIGVFIGIVFMCIFDINNINKHICLHCGKGNGVYCETCYQDLISENAKLQYEKNTYKKARQEFENQIKKENMELCNKYVNHIPHID